mmetsp:Transcript_422/g.663  ORF Transcript_422/g.663 Transcript_422/m.663 type:complete len:155 (-) Transcript_422:121-585(-)
MERLLVELTEELQEFKHQGAIVQREQKVEIRELREMLEKEKFERREAAHTLRYEFEEAARHKTPALMPLVHAAKEEHQGNDAVQHAMILELRDHVERIKSGLLCVDQAYQSLCRNCLQDQKHRAPQRTEPRRAIAGGKGQAGLLADALLNAAIP